MKQIYALYDLGKAPPTFDFLSWLVNVSDLASRQEHDKLNIAFKPGPNHGFKQDDLPPDVVSRAWMFEHIVKPAVAMVGAEIVYYNENQEYIEKGYLLGNFVRDVKENPRPIPIFVPDLYAKRLVDKQLGDKDFVTITLRHSAYWPERNSNFKSWLLFAKFLKAEGFEVIFIPDVENAFQQVGEFESISAATFDLNIRSSLYDKAIMNFGVNSGPCHLLYFSTTPYLIFKQLVNDVPCRDEGWWEREIGLKKGEQYPWAHQAQILAWEDDGYDNLKEGYDNLIIQVKNVKRRNILQPSIVSNTGAKRIAANCKFALSRGLKELKRPVSAHSKNLVIAAGGPSLRYTTHEFPEDAHVLAVNNTYKYLLDNGIVADYMAMFDARNKNIHFVDNVNKKTNFLIASQCDPKVFTSLKKQGAKVTLWHANNGEVMPDWLQNDRMLVSGGSTIGLRCLNLAYLMGYRKVHLFGFDSCWESEHTHHAYEQTSNDTDDSYTIAIGEGDARKEFRVSTWMARQYEDFKDFVKFHGEKIDIVMYGEGLIPHYCRMYNSAVEEKEAA